MRMRRLLIGIAAVLVSGMTLIAPAVLPSAATAVASAQADPCPAVQVVFARGTGEPDGTGRVGEAFVDALRPMVKGKSVAVYAVNYPATRDFLRAADGANDASLFVQNTATTCPDTKIVLGGYSQGAAVVDAITVADQPTLGFTQPMPANIADHVSAVAVFGNPSIRLLGAPLTTLSPLYGYKAIDLCNGADPVCSDGNDVAAHSLYVQSGMATQAAQFVAERITNQAPISTLAGEG
jgi:cutinase